MADKKFLLLIPVLWFLLIPKALWGQERPGGTGSGSFYIERTGEEERFIQRLAWEQADYAYRYEIVVEERNSSGIYTEIHRGSQTENYVDLSLAPGLYRYRVGVYNLLNRRTAISEWTYFRVLPALEPELFSFIQEFPPPVEGEAGTMEIILYGKNIQEGAEVYLRPVGTPGDPVAPLAYLPQEDGQRARLVFNRDTFAPGRYRVRVRNPGGLEGSMEITLRSPPPVIAAPGDSGAADSAAAGTGDSGPEEARDADSAPAVVSAASDTAPNDAAPRPLDFEIVVEYAPLLPLYGYLFDLGDRAFYPLGFSLRIGILPIHASWGDLGLELAPSWNMHKAGDLRVHMGTFHLNGIYQLWLPNRMFSFVFRAGAGLTFLYGTGMESNFVWVFDPAKNIVTYASSSQDSWSIFTWIASLNGGFSFRWTPARVFFLEIGAGYTHVFSTDSPQMGYIKPSAGIGWRF
jgi:hypothetical protein